MTLIATSRCTSLSHLHTNGGMLHELYLQTHYASTIARTIKPKVHARKGVAGEGLPPVDVAKGSASDDLKTFEPVGSHRRSRLWVWVRELLHYVYRPYMQCSRWSVC